jgi:tetratricopeptide (TPR) repeat protein/uncharacterized caspase-like protein
MKTHAKISSTVVAIAVLISAAIISDAPSAAAQDQRERGMKVVGASRSDVNAGRVNDIGLWAVIIGVSRYQFGEQDLDGYHITNLKNAADDAQALYEFFKSPEGGGFRDESEGGHMIMLKDDQATKANVQNALTKLNQAKPNDYFVLYIAAHGMIMPFYDAATKTTTEVPYFVLYDTDLRKPDTAFKMDLFRKAVSEIPAKKGLVLSDTCHSGGVQLAGRDSADSSKRANIRFQREMNGIGTGVGFISAADQLEQSFERSDFNHGVFTHCLLEALAGSADTNNDGTVTFDEVSGYLRDEVPKLTNNMQHPKSNTTAIDANYLPLSVVSYSDVGAPGTPDQYGLIQIRTPDVDGVEVAIDGKRFATFNAGTQRSVMTRTGTRSITFTKGPLSRELKTRVESGKPKVVEVNLTFSESDASEDSLVDPTDQQVGVYLRDEKEPSKQAKDLFTRGVDSFNKQKLEEALDSFNRAIQANAGVYADAFVFRGRIEQSLGRKRDAVTSFKQAFALRPTDFETQTLLAEAKFNAGDNVDEVVSDLRSIIRRHPNFDFARVVYGDVLLSRKDYARAELELKRAVTINPKSPPAHLILADVLTYQDSKEKRKRAVDEAEKALQLFDEVSKKQHSIGRSLSRLSISHVIFGGGRYINDAATAEAHWIAAKALTRMVGYDYDNSIPDPEIYLDRARTHLQEAMKLAQRASSKDRLALVLETSAMNHFLKGNIPQALQDGEQSLKIRESIPQLKDDPDIYSTLSQIYESDQKFLKAAEHQKRFIDLSGSQLSTRDRQSAEERLVFLKRQADANRQKH